MRRGKRLIALAAGVALLAAACGDDSGSSGTSAATTTPATTAAPTTAAPETTAPETTAAETTAPETTAAETTTTYAPPKRGDADLVIWADDTRAPVLRPLAEEFATQEGIKVAVFEVPFDQIRTNISVAGPAGEGPDIIIGAHDWLGELVSNGSVAPLDLGAEAAKYSPSSIAAFSYDGKLYGLPYGAENIALIRNTALVPEAPKTFEELEQIALQLVKDGKAEIPLAIQQGGTGDPYHDYPLFTGAGGELFGQNPDGSYIASDLRLDSEGSLKAADKFAAWTKEGLLSKDITYDIMIEKFGTGKAPFAITGPWAVNQADNGFKATGVPYAVEPIPPIEGNTPKVFIGVQGFMISAFSKQQDLAKTFLLDYVNTEDVQVKLFEAGGRPPAMLSAFDKVKSDPDVAGFGLSGQQGAPMPAIPAMGKVWGAWTDAYTIIFSGGDARKAFQDAAASIRAEIEKLG